jgi:DNA-binding NarL/FixJ family response regulator
MGKMSLPLEVILVSNCPIFAEPLRHWLEARQDALMCRLVTHPDAAGLVGPDARTIVAIAPQDWREMSRWLPGLWRGLRACPWLLLADLRLAGMFWPCLEARLCTIVPLGSPPEQLPLSLRVLSLGQSLCPPSNLMDSFSAHAPALPDGTRPVLTSRELQCGCAISLGLSNQQITEILHMGMSTLKGHITHLMRKLNVTERHDVENYFERALGPSSHTPGMGQ